MAGMNSSPLIRLTLTRQWLPPTVTEPVDRRGEVLPVLQYREVVERERDMERKAQEGVKPQ
jgi:hypothetical protein